MTPHEIGVWFNRMIQEAVGSPETVNRNELLLASEAFLTAAQGGDPDSLSLARGMAFRAMDWCVWSTPENYQLLVCAVRAFGLCTRIKLAIDKMAP